MDQENRRLYFFYKFLDQIGLNRVFRYLLSDRPKIVMYHGIIDDSNDIECWWLIKQSSFVRQIRYIKKNFNVISIDKVYSYISSNEALPRNTCILSFDDGYKNYLTKVLPILRAEQLPSIVYIPSGISASQGKIWTDRVFYAFYRSSKTFLDLNDANLGMWRMSSKNDRIKAAHGVINLLKRTPPENKYTLIDLIISKLGIINESSKAERENSFAILSIKDIEKLSSDPLVTIGSHSVNHEILTQLSIKEADKEIRRSKGMLEEWINKPVNHFSYPDGKWNSTIAELVKKAGYKTATRIGLGLFRNNQLFQVPRLAVGFWDNHYSFKSMVNGVTTIKVETEEFLGKLLQSNRGSNNFA